jgi:hypothetical protein
LPSLFQRTCDQKAAKTKFKSFDYEKGNVVFYTILPLCFSFYVFIPSLFSLSRSQILSAILLCTFVCELPFETIVAADVRKGPQTLPPHESDEWQLVKAVPSATCPRKES